MNDREGRIPVLKNVNGTIIEPESLPSDGLVAALMVGCWKQEHDVRWGPLCRVMKRKPKGKEWVHTLCKTCGNYVEYVK